MQINIREAARGDIKKLKELLKIAEALYKKDIFNIYKMSNGPNFTTKYAKELLNKSNETIFVAEIDKDIVGMIHVSIKTSNDNHLMIERKFGWIDDLIIKEEFKESGVASFLIKTSESWLTGKNVKRVELDVFELNNNTSANIYNNIGYETMSRRIFKKL